jgi:RNA polymerase sigma factor (sigma-70 family)
MSRIQNDPEAPESWKQLGLRYLKRLSNPNSLDELEAEVGVAYDPVAPLEREEVRKTLYDALGKLDKAERIVVVMHYGLPVELTHDNYDSDSVVEDDVGPYDLYSLEEIASIFRQSKERIAAIRARAISKLQRSRRPAKLAKMLFSSSV